MSPQERDRLWKAARRELETWTQIIPNLPKEEVVRERALIAVRKVAYDSFPSHDQLPVIASEISLWICRNFNASKRRPPPKSSRVNRDLRDDDIARAYSEAKALGTPMSIRSLARKHSVSASTAWRILEKHGLIPENTKISSSKELGTAKRILEQLLPAGAKRAINRGLLAEKLGIDLSSLWSQLDAIKTTYRGWYFYPCYQDVVISRGRTLTPAQVFDWRKRARASSVSNPKRKMAHIGSAVWGDLLVFVAVWSRNASADDWSELLRLTTWTPKELSVLRSSGEHYRGLTRYSIAEKLECPDFRILANRVRIAFKSTTDHDQVRSIELVNSEHRSGAAVLREILYLVEYTWDLGLEDALTVWTRATAYEARVELGLLHRRKSEDIETFLVVARQFERDELSLDELMSKKSGPV
jgi:transposase-like protein